MEDKHTPVADNPVATTDQATNESSSQAPTAAAEQGVSDAAAPQGTMQASSEESPAAPDAQPEAATSGMSEVEAAVSQAQEDTANASSADSSESSDPASDTSVGSEAAGSDSDDASASENMTMEEVMAASDEQLGRKPVHRGMLITGTVIMLAQDGVVVDVGAKVEGLVPYNQLFEFETNAEEAAKYFKSGDDIQVYVIRADIPNNTITLSKKRADQERAWNLLNEIHEKKLPVEVEIVEKVRGGLVANLGVRAFLPASQVDVRRVNDLTPFVNQRLKVRIIELNRKRNRVIISRRSIIEDEVREKKAETLQKLEPGARLEGEVVEITDFGAFVNLGGIDGLVHRSEISHGRFNHPREVLKLGQEVKVEVLDMDIERERINLSMKKLIPDPWQHVLSKYQISQRIGGKVTNLTSFGAFVEIEPGLEGLIHVSEMSWTKRVRHPREVVKEGDDVEAMILKIDIAQQRISLGLRQTQPDPWSSLPDRFPPGTEVRGPVTGLTEFGVFMEIEEGIEGLIHISELAHEHIDDVSQHFNKGDEIEAVIINIDPVEQRASLSRKRLLPYTASAADDASGAPSNRSGRKGRRGGRRGQGIDYDYSYAASDAGSKTTTKLGDVYADLFAQFGLSEARNEPEESSKADNETSSEATSATSETAQATAATEAPATEAPATEAPAEAKPEAKAEAPAAAKASQDSEEDSENAIDAAEAAALLTAAFRQGKRPPKSDASQDSEKDSNGEKDKEPTEA